MENVSSLIDSLKGTTYEVSAILLPGVVVFRASCLLNVWQAPEGGLENVLAAYLVGVALQGIANAFAQWPRLRRWLGRTSTDDAAALAARIVRERLHRDVPQSALFDVCLSRIESRRQVYDRFIALRDMARGLVLASITAGAIATAHYAIARSYPKAAVSAFVATVACFGFFERWRRFYALPNQVVYGQFLASFIDTPNPQGDQSNSQAQRRGEGPKEKGE